MSWRRRTRWSTRSRGCAAARWISCASRSPRRIFRTLTSRALSTLGAARSKSFLAQSRTLLDPARLLSATTDRHVLPARALEVACRDFQADGAVLLAYDAAQDALSVVAHTGKAMAGWAHSVQLDAQGKEAMGTGDILLATDAGTGDCYAYAPLKAGEQTRGVLGLRRIGGPQLNEKSTPSFSTSSPCT